MAVQPWPTGWNDYGPNTSKEQLDYYWWIQPWVACDEYARVTGRFPPDLHHAYTEDTVVSVDVDAEGRVTGLTADGGWTTHAWKAYVPTGPDDYDPPDYDVVVEPPCNRDPRLAFQRTITAHDPDGAAPNHVALEPVDWWQAAPSVGAARTDHPFVGRRVRVVRAGANGTWHRRWPEWPNSFEYDAGMVAMALPHAFTLTVAAAGNPELDGLSVAFARHPTADATWVGGGGAWTVYLTTFPADGTTHLRWHVEYAHPAGVCHWTFDVSDPFNTAVAPLWADGVAGAEAACGCADPKLPDSFTFACSSWSGVYVKDRAYAPTAFTGRVLFAYKFGVAGGVRLRKTVTGCTAHTINFAPSADKPRWDDAFGVLQDAGDYWEGGRVSWGPKFWCRGPHDYYQSNRFDGSVGAVGPVPKDQVQYAAEDDEGDPITVFVPCFDADVWTPREGPGVSPRETCLTPDMYKTPRGLQVYLESLVPLFIKQIVPAGPVYLTFAEVLPGGWPAVYPKQVWHVYARSAWVPDADTLTGLTAVDPPTDALPGFWFTRPASAGPLSYTDKGVNLDTADGFVAGKLYRFAGDQYDDPTTDALVADYETPYRAKLYEGQRTPADAGRMAGTATAGGAGWIRGAFDAWPGTRVEHNGTPTSISSTGLSDTTKATSYFWNEQGVPLYANRLVGLVVEVVQDPGDPALPKGPHHGQKRFVASQVGGSQSIAFSTPVPGLAATWTDALGATRDTLYRIREPSDARDKWQGRRLTVTNPDGSTFTTPVLHNDADALFFDAAFTAQPGARYAFAELPIGSVVKWDGAKFVAADRPWADEPLATVTHHRFSKGDYLIPLYDSYRTVFAAMNGKETLAGFSAWQAGDPSPNNKLTSWHPEGTWALFEDHSQNGDPTGEPTNHGYWNHADTETTVTTAPFGMGKSNNAYTWTGSAFVPTSFSGTLSRHASKAYTVKPTDCLGVSANFYAYAIAWPLDPGYQGSTAFDALGTGLVEDDWYKWSTVAADPLLGDIRSGTLGSLGNPGYLGDPGFPATGGVPGTYPKQLVHGFQVTGRMVTYSWEFAW
jgi:hypothetical protein